MLGQVLRSKVFSIKYRAKPLETFVELVLSGLSTFIYKVDDSRLKAVRNTARYMTQSLYSKRENERFNAGRSLDAQLQKLGLTLWASLENEGQNYCQTFI